MADHDQTTSPPPRDRGRDRDQTTAHDQTDDRHPPTLPPTPAPTPVPTPAPTPAPPQDETLDSALRDEIEREVDAAFADVAPLEADAEDEPAARPPAADAPSAAAGTGAGVGAGVGAGAGATGIQEPPLTAGPVFDDDRESDREAERVLMEEVAQLAAAEEEVRRSGRPPEETTPAPEEPAPGPEETPPEPAPTTVEAVEQNERRALLAEQPADGRPQDYDEEVPGDQPAQADPAPGPLLPLPLRVLVLLLGIIDLPFRRLGPKTRCVLGRFAIGYLVAAALILAYVLLRPLFS